MTPPLITPSHPEPNTTQSSNLPSSTTATTMTARTPVDLNEINSQLIRSIQSLRRMNERLQQQQSTTTTMTTTPTDSTHQQDTTKTARNDLPLTLTATTTNALTSDRLRGMPTTTTTMTATPSQPTLQKHSPLPPSFTLPKEIPQPATIDNAPPRPLIREIMESDHLCKRPYAFCSGNCSAAGLTTTTPEPLLRSKTSRSFSPSEAAQPAPTEPPKREPVDLAAIRAQIRASMATLDRLFPLPMPTTTTLPPQQPEPPLPPSSSTAPTEPPKRETVDLAAIRAQISASMATLDRLFPLQSPTTTMPLPLQQPDSPLHPPTPSPTMPNTTPDHAPFDLADNNSQLFKNMENMDHITLPEPLPMTPQTTTPPAVDHSDTPSAPLATTPILVILSRIDRLLNNTRTCNNTLWKPDALNRRPTYNRPIGHSQITVHHLAHATGHFPFPATILHRLNNPLDADYDTLQYTPAFDIHLPWQVKHPKLYQHPQCLLLATNVKAFVHNMRPP